MTRNDFELIAEVLKETKPPELKYYDRMYEGAVRQWIDTCVAFATRLRLVNPRFDRARFLTACGLDPQKD